MTNSIEEQGIYVPAHMIAHPKSISKEARQIIANLAAMPHAQPFPSITDREAWLILQHKYNEDLMLAYLPVPEEPISIEKQILNDIPVFITSPEGADPHRIYLHIHGGGFVFGSGESCRRMALLAARNSRAKTVSPDYRMPPDFPYPTPLDDCLSVYQAVLEEYKPEQIVVGGGSAGGNLAAAMILKARDAGMALPAGLILLSPEVDLTESGDSFTTNRYIDVVLRESLEVQNALYANGHDLSHPYISPLFGDFHPGFTKTFLQTGTRDLFLSNTVRMHRTLLNARVEAELHVFEAMPHGGFLGTTPEDLELHDAMRRFIESCWNSSMII